MLTHHDRKRKDLMIEAEFLPNSLEEAADVRARILETVRNGGSIDAAPANAESVADEITGWLIGKVGGVDGKAATTRARYRRILAAVQAGPDGHGRQAGYATVTSIGAAGGLSLAGAGAAAGSPTAAALALVVTAIAVWAARHNLRCQGIYVMSSSDGGLVLVVELVPAAAAGRPHLELAAAA